MASAAEVGPSAQAVGAGIADQPNCPPGGCDPDKAIDNDCIGTSMPCSVAMTVASHRFSAHDGGRTLSTLPAEFALYGAPNPVEVPPPR
ncbi:MAG: hypothetical protein AAFW98_06765 [Pseudomonadota bacterium]